jgi:hypothetical protein
MREIVEQSGRSNSRQEVQFSLTDEQAKPFGEQQNMTQPDGLPPLSQREVLVRVGLRKSRSELSIN